MTRLGLRLALAGGRAAIGGVVLTAIAVAVGTAILLYAASFVPALADRDLRTAWRDGFHIANDGGTLVLVVEDRMEGRLLTRVHVAPTEGGAGAPVPPPVATMPGPGEAYVSPALSALLATTPADVLGERIGRVVGTIDGPWLASPDELLAVIGNDADDLRSNRSYTVSAFGSVPPPLELPPIGALIVVLAAVGAMAPVAVFVATATRMSAARRELRLSTLRLVGATPRQIARLATVEALIATSLGALGGVGLFFAGRPLVARIPLDGATWWPDAIVPPVPVALGLLLAVQVAGAAGALLAMRRLTITPLGVQRRTQPSRPGAWRVLPVVLAVGALLAAIAVYRGGSLPDGPSLAMAGLAFAGIIGGLAFAGPWLTVTVGRALHQVARGASTLLAARRLEDEPRGSFGAIAGVIMAVFVASAFFTFSAYTRSQAGSDTDPLLRPGAIVAQLGGGAATEGPGLNQAVAGIAGVTDVVAIREVALVRDEGIVGFAWLASCPEVVRILGLDATGCVADGLTSVSGAALDGPYRLVSELSDPNGLPLPSADIVLGTVPSSGLLTGRGELAPLLPDVLIDPTAFDATVAAAFPVTRLYVATDTSVDVGERVRTAIVAREPSANVRFETETLVGDGRFEEIGRIVGLGLIGTMALAGCSLAVAVTTATLERRRQFVFLRSAGMPASSLRVTILLQAGVPLATIAAVSAALGGLVGSGVLWVAAGTVVVPDASLLGVLAASVAVALAIVLLTLPPLERMTRPASLRHE